MRHDGDHNFVAGGKFTATTKGTGCRAWWKTETRIAITEYRARGCVCSLVGGF